MPSSPFALAPSALLLAALALLPSCSSSSDDLFGDDSPSPSGSGQSGQGGSAGGNGSGGSSAGSGGASSEGGQAGSGGLQGAAGMPEVFGAGGSAATSGSPGAAGQDPGAGGSGPAGAGGKGAAGKGAGPGMGGQGAGPGTGGTSENGQIACLTTDGDTSTQCAPGLGCCLVDGPNPCTTQQGCQQVDQSFGFIGCDGPEDCQGGVCCIGKDNYDTRCASSCNQKNENPICHPGGPPCPGGKKCQIIDNLTIYGECVGG